MTKKILTLDNIPVIKKNIGRIDTIEKLKASTIYSLGDVVEVLGFYTKGDGAHHLRIAKSTDDGSGELGVDGLIWCILHNGEANVSWFGAKGDGVTDDTNAIRKAFSEYKNIVFENNKEYLINPTQSIQIDSCINIDFNFSKIILKETSNISVFVSKNNIQYTTKELSIKKDCFVLKGFERDNFYKISGIPSERNDSLIVDEYTLSKENNTIATSINTDYAEYSTSFRKLKAHKTTIKNACFLRQQKDGVSTIWFYIIDSDNYSFENIQFEEKVSNLGNEQRFNIFTKRCSNIELQNVYSDKLMKLNKDYIYCFAFYETIFIKIKKVTAITLDNVYSWASLATHDCKELVVENSTLDRIDSHRNLRNCKIINTKTKSIGVSGYGDLIIDNVEIYDSENYAPIMLRRDSTTNQGGYWSGDIFINNVKLHTLESKTGTYSLIYLDEVKENSTVKHHFKNLHINNLEIIESSNYQYNGFKFLSSYGDLSGIEESPYSITIENLIKKTKIPVVLGSYIFENENGSEYFKKNCQGETSIVTKDNYGGLVNDKSTLFLKIKNVDFGEQRSNLFLKIYNTTNDFSDTKVVYECLFDGCKNLTLFNKTIQPIQFVRCKVNFFKGAVGSYLPLQFSIFNSCVFLNNIIPSDIAPNATVIAFRSTFVNCFFGDVYYKTQVLKPANYLKETEALRSNFVNCSVLVDRDSKTFTRASSLNPFQ